MEEAISSVSERHADTTRVGRLRPALARRCQRACVRASWVDDGADARIQAWRTGTAAASKRRVTRSAKTEGSHVGVSSWLEKNSPSDRAINAIEVGPARSAK